MEHLLVVALGPDPTEKMTLEAARALQSADLVLLRTKRHGAAQWLTENRIPFTAFDDLHDSAEDFEAFSASVANAVRAHMQPGKTVCYAVAEPQTDQTVLALVASGVKARVLAGVTHASVAQANALEAQTPSGGACCLSAVDVAGASINPDLPLIITELHSRLLAGDVKIALLCLYPPETLVFFCGEAIALSALDRQKRYDHLSAVFVPACPYEKRRRFVLSDLEKIMARLRDPVGGCPWDLQQTHRSLREFLLEEAYEVIDAIDANDPLRIADELGDVLLQVVFHAQIAKEHGAFSLQDVVTAICAKMVSRHAHIFAGARCDSADDVLKSWEAIKKKEKNLRGVSDAMRDIPGQMPSLQRAGKVLEKAKRAGYPQGTAPALLSARQKLAGFHDASPGIDAETTIGALLFDCASLAKAFGVEPELALKKAVDRFIQSFQSLEQWARAAGKKTADLTDEEFFSFLSPGEEA